MADAEAISQYIESLANQSIKQACAASAHKDRAGRGRPPLLLPTLAVHVVG
jgi:hypothetical protein